MDREIETTKVSARGQVVIPKRAREKLGWRIGDHVIVEVRGDAVILRKLELEALLDEAEDEWARGETVTLWPKS